MQLESLRVELRPRSPWEAVELGSALVRKNARAIWLPWFLLTLPVFALVSAAAWAIGQVWIAWLAMWWLKPVFDRIPMFVLSRAVFGETPGIRQTLAAQARWGWRAMWSMLTWRRFGPMRALTLPVDLLEGAEPMRLRERRRVLASGVAGTGLLLTVVCIAFVVVLALSVLALVVMFLPFEFLPESTRALWALARTDPPRWLQVALHAVAWGATSAIEPFYVGAGFGLYLNRRTQLEAWDVEIAFRRLRTRLRDAAAPTLLAIACAVCLPASLPVHAAAAAATEDAAPREEAATLADVFGDDVVDARGFDKAVKRAYADPLLRPKGKEMIWQARHPDKSDERDKPARHPSPLLALLLSWVSTIAGFVGESGAWLLLVALVVVLALTARRWWPWLRGADARAETAAPVDVADAALPDVLPDDIAGAARALWREGRPRRALALAYRASVDSMAQRSGVALVPGATESECLRASRRMPEPEDREAFSRIVRTWQYAAYAQRLPEQDDFESLLGTLSQRFGWAR